MRVGIRTRDFVGFRGISRGISRAQETPHAPRVHAHPAANWPLVPLHSKGVASAIKSLVLLRMPAIHSHSGRHVHYARRLSRLAVSARCVRALGFVASHLTPFCDTLAHVDARHAQDFYYLL